MSKVSISLDSAVPHVLAILGILMNQLLLLSQKMVSERSYEIQCLYLKLIFMHSLLFFSFLFVSCRSYSALKCCVDLVLYGLVQT